jgi:formate hydrogenlyase subunit 3/multisubunit Na+/H+ antiporter MnhD subunit
MVALHEHVRAAYTHLLISILLPTLHFALTLLILDKVSKSVLLSILALSCTLPLASYTSIWFRLTTTQQTRHPSAQPHPYDLLWVLPAGVYASISTIQRLFLAALYALTMSHHHSVPQGVLGFIYALGLVEWVIVSRVTIELWRASRESDFKDVEKTYGIRM